MSQDSTEENQYFISRFLLCFKCVRSVQQWLHLLPLRKKEIPKQYIQLENPRGVSIAWHSGWTRQGPKALAFVSEKFAEPEVKSWQRKFAEPKEKLKMWWTWGLRFSSIVTSLCSIYKDLAPHPFFSSHSVGWYVWYTQPQ